MSVQALPRSLPRRVVTARGKTAKRGQTIAVVGCGYWGAKHVRVVNSLPTVDEVIAVDPNPRARRAIAASFPSVVAVPDLAPVLPRVDGVIIATPPRHHATAGLQALRAGVPVLIEKPLAASLSESHALVGEAARQGVPLMVGHTFEFNPVVAELRRRMDAGELGDIRYIHSARLSLGLFRSDVNVVWDLAPHDVSIMSYLLRAQPTTVSAWGSAHVSSGIADLAYFQLTFAESGVTGYGHISWLDPRKVRQVTVVGSRRMAVYDDLADEKLRIFDRGVDHAHEEDRDTPPGGMPITYRYGDVVSPHIDLQEPLLIEDRHFVECVRTGTAPLSDGASGLAVVSVLDAIDRSIATGRAEPVKPPATTATVIPARMTA